MIIRILFTIICFLGLRTAIRSTQPSMTWSKITLSTITASIGSITSVLSVNTGIIVALLNFFVTFVEFISVLAVKIRV